ncbi:MAG TPA: divalent-cation tolerance protein CutA [Candidatus Sabulitectum sp.]|nr:divalent-cation tolerance protein CutA [Candidatus Sabulitectum sp.]
MEVQPIQITSTYPTREEAVRVGGEAVRLHMAACAQVTSEITSVYRWEGKIKSGREFQLKLKTLSTSESQLIGWLKEKHPYKVAEILVIPLSYVAPDYLAWMREVVH